MTQLFPKGFHLLAKMIKSLHYFNYFFIENIAYDHHCILLVIKEQGKFVMFFSTHIKSKDKTKLHLCVLSNVHMNR